MSQLWILIRKIEVLGALFGSGDKEIVTKKKCLGNIFTPSKKTMCLYQKKLYSLWHSKNNPFTGDNIPKSAKQMH